MYVGTCKDSVVVSLGRSRFYCRIVTVSLFFTYVGVLVVVPRDAREAVNSGRSGSSCPYRDDLSDSLGDSGRTVLTGPTSSSLGLRLGSGTATGVHRFFFS